MPTYITLVNPSESIDSVNIPEVKNLSAEFFYNFYVYDERVNKTYDKRSNGTLLPLKNLPRYTVIRWSRPSLSDFTTNPSDLNGSSKINSKTSGGDYTIASNASKIISEDDSFNIKYYDHTFSNISAITQGASDLKVYNSITGRNTDSIYKMTKYRLEQLRDVVSSDDLDAEAQLSSLASSYASLADFPKDTYGLRVFGPNGSIDDSDDLLRSITKNISLTVKVHETILSDVFENAVDKEDPATYASLSTRTNSNLGSLQRKNAAYDGLLVVPIGPGVTYDSYNNQSVKLIGYIIDRYVVTSDGFKKDVSYYLEDIQQTSFEDRSVLYGLTYLYAVRVVASVDVVVFDDTTYKTAKSYRLYISSRPTSTPVECYEYVPPPVPQSLKFIFDYTARNLIINWDMPVNPQKDVKQFQVFRRESINEPFELIAQYGFDKSIPGPDGSRYKTNEVVDANKYDSMPEELKYLVTLAEGPVYLHTDKDFTVDTEFFISSKYIYAVCAVDAHGMISNYSAQHEVTFDPYKNKLDVNVVCDAGSPKQYPNMNLRFDAFKDTIRTSGDAMRQMDVYFTPEAKQVIDNKSQYPLADVFVTTSTGNDKFYVMQFINLDNQKTQNLKLKIRN